MPEHGHLARLQWLHPRLGRMSETVCNPHREQLIGALNLLGIGCVGAYKDAGDECDRCSYAGQPFRTWMDQVREHRG